MSSDTAREPQNRLEPQNRTEPFGYEQYGSDEELITGEAVALDLRPTTFVLRVAGGAIDVAVIGILAGATVFGVANLGLIIDPAATQAVVVSLLVFFTVLAPTAVETISRGRSLGKLAIGARIVRDDGGAIGFRHAFIRSLTGLLEIFFTVGGLAIIVTLLGARSKRLGDLLAGTYSQNERVTTRVAPLVFVPPQLAEWALTADVARMPDRLSRRIGQFLRQSGGMLPAARARVAEELAREAAPWISPLPDVQPEFLLQAVTAIRRDRETAALERERERLALLEPELAGLPHRFPTRG